MRISDWSSDVCSSDLAYYADRLKNSTTTDLTADHIHELGLKQVAAIRQEMEAIKREVGFKGTLEQFFDHIRTDPKLKYPNTEADRKSVVQGKSVSVRGDLGGRRIIKKNNQAKSRTKRTDKQ